MKIIAMDIGGCCIRLTPERFFTPLGLNSFNPQFFPDALNTWGGLFETGKISRNEFARNVVEAYHLDGVTEEFFLKCWGNFIGEGIPGMAELFDELQARDVKIVLFSDTSEFHVEVFMERTPFLRKADGFVYSHEVGWRKPDRHMYEAFELKYGKPDLYVDDRANNIEAGRASGWSVHAFTSVEELRNCLVEAQIL